MSWILHYSGFHIESLLSVPTPSSISLILISFGRSAAKNSGIELGIEQRDGGGNSLIRQSLSERAPPGSWSKRPRYVHSHQVFKDSFKEWLRILKVRISPSRFD